MQKKKTIPKEAKDINIKTPFFIFDKKALLQNVKSYKKNLPPKTEICYAMKSNSEIPLLSVMKDLKMSFEVASSGELSVLKKLKVFPKNIIHGTAIKSEFDIKEFAKYGVDRFAFDSEEELTKIAKLSPKARVYVRVLVDDKADSVFNMSEKFGISLQKAVSLLLKAKELGLVPYGISFNVGSQARNANAWANGIADIGKIMTKLLKEKIKIQVINIGGGMPYKYQENEPYQSIDVIGKSIREAWKKLPYKVDCIAEPGRALSANAYMLVLTVIAKVERENGHWLYVDAGIYNALLEASMQQGSTQYKMEELSKKKNTKMKLYIVTGPTGDNLDVIGKNIFFSEDISVGDRIIVHDVGAYSFTLMTNFNGFSKPKTIDK